MSDDNYEDFGDGDSEEYITQNVGMDEFGSFNIEEESAEQLIGTFKGMFDKDEFGYETEQSDPDEKTVNMDQNLSFKRAELETAISSLKASKTPEQVANRSAQVKALNEAVRRAEASEAMNDNSEMVLDYNTGMPSATTVAANQFSAQSPQVQQVLNQAVDGTIDMSRASGDKGTAMAAVEAGREVLGDGVAKLTGNIRAEQLPGQVTTFTPEMVKNYSPDLEKQNRLHGVSMDSSDASYLAQAREQSEALIADLPSVTAAPGSVDVKLALGQLSKMPEYQDRGVMQGSMAPQMTGNVEEDHEFALIQNKLNKLVYGLIPDNHGNDNVKRARFESVQQAYITRLMDGPSIEAKSLIPLPNEMFIGEDNTAITGLIPTMGGFRGDPSRASTPYTRLEYAKAVAVGGELHHLTMQEDDRDLARLRPSVANTYFPIDKSIDLKDWQSSPEGSDARVAKAKQAAQVEEMYEDAKAVAKYYRRKFPHMHNEASGDARWGGHTKLASDAQSNWNEAAVYGLAPEKEQMEHEVRQTAQIAPSQKDENGDSYVPDAKYGSQIHAVRGSDRSTKHGDSTGMVSEASVFVNMLEGGASVDLAYEQALNPASADYEQIEREKVRAAVGQYDPNWTDLQKYDEELRHAPEQLSKEWFAQREGLNTASTATKMLRDPMKRGLFMAEERLDPRGTIGRSKGNEPFYGNHYTWQGNAGEGKVARAFMSEIHQQGKKNKNVFEDAVFREGYFETNNKYEGMGASPDGMLFDKEGNSLGLLEFKFLGDKGAEKALETYTDQMQMQMLVTGEEFATLAVLNTQTGEFSQDTIQADKAHQDRIIEASRISQETNKSIKNWRDREVARDLIPKSKGNRTSPTGVVAKQEVATEAALPEDFDSLSSAEQNAILLSEGSKMTAYKSDTADSVKEQAEATSEARYNKALSKDKVSAESAALKEDRSRDLATHNLSPFEAGAQRQKAKNMMATNEQAIAEDQQFEAEKAAADKEALAVRKELTSAQGQAIQMERAREVELKNSSLGGSFKRLKDHLKSSSGLLETFTKVLSAVNTVQTNAVETQHDAKQLARAIGDGGDRVMAANYELLGGGLRDNEPAQLLKQAGKLVNSFRDVGGAASYHARVQSKLARVKRPDLMHVMDWNNITKEGQLPTDWLHTVASAGEDLNNADRLVLYNALEVDLLTGYDSTQTKNGVDGLQMYMNVGDSGAYYAGKAEIAQDVQGVAQTTVLPQGPDAMYRTGQVHQIINEAEKVGGKGPVADLLKGYGTLWTTAMTMSENSSAEKVAPITDMMSAWSDKTVNGDIKETGFWEGTGNFIGTFGEAVRDGYNSSNPFRKDVSPSASIFAPKGAADADLYARVAAAEKRDVPPGSIYIYNTGVTTEVDANEFKDVNYTVN